MSLFSIASVRSRLWAGLTIVILVFLGAGVYALLSLENARNITTKMYKHPMAVSNAVTGLDGEASRLLAALKDAAWSENPRQLDQAIKRIGASEKEVNARLSVIKDRYLGPKKDVDATNNAVVAWPAVRDKVLALARNGDQSATQEAFEREGQAWASTMNEPLNVLKNFAKSKGEQFYAAADANASRVFSISMSLFGLGFIASCLVGFWLLRSVMRPLGAEPEQVRLTVERFAKGDLTEDIDLRAANSDSVVAALRHLQINLTGMVGRVRANSESVASASLQIADGNKDLSRRTEDQATALQETASTMDEMSATVRNNTESAKRANGLAQDASTVAGQGGEVVGKVVTTMESINESSRNIGDIISVIDGIAFQTNILALNAAVEAARAGEQGRGFAVVASEVRNLAQRSAEASKEIKTLIVRSIEQVDQGTSLVSVAGKTMNEIVDSIQQVRDIVAEITSATLEQSSGIQQIGETVNQIDQTTQQNTALVEESAAAAESLKGQSQELVQAVAVFKLPRVEERDEA